jgi:hypothetical protein
MAGAPSRFASELRRRTAELGRLEPAVLAARLTLVCLLLAPVGLFDVRAALLVLAAAGLLAPALAVWAPFWWLAAALLGVRVVYDWPLPDNHAYLLACWCVALAAACASEAPSALLARNARLLVGAAFALAVVQKVLVSPDFLDGTFFRWVLADDPRFEQLGRLLGRDGAALESTRALLRTPPGTPPPAGASFFETPALRLAASLLTGATLALETWVAAAFLAPPRLVPGAARDAGLLVFCVLTYAIAPVSGFGWMLVAMGVAQSASAKARWLFLAVFALITFYEEVPWLEALADLVARSA